MLATNPETFEILTKNNVKLFHGTNANVLPSILSHGINSVDQLSKKGITVSTGEKWSRTNNERSFISFTDDLDTALEYASIKPSKDAQKETSFGVLLGISPNDITKMKTCTVHSDIPEIGIMDNVPLEYIKVIAVPKSKVNFVRKLITDNRIIVTPIDTHEKFYYMDSFGITFNAEKAKELVKGKEQRDTMPSFNSEKIKKLASGRITSGIQDIYKKIQEKIKSRGKNNEKDSKDGRYI